MKLSTKEKLRKLAKLKNVDVETMKVVVKTGAMISNVSFTEALNASLEVLEKPTGLTMSVSAKD